MRRRVLAFLQGVGQGSDGQADERVLGRVETGSSVIPGEEGSNDTESVVESMGIGGGIAGDDSKAWDENGGIGQPESTIRAKHTCKKDMILLIKLMGIYDRSETVDEETLT